MGRKQPVNASSCHSMLRRLAEQYKEMEARLREGGRDDLADKEHEHYEAMITAMTVLVKTHNI